MAHTSFRVGPFDSLVLVGASQMDSKAGHNGMQHTQLRFVLGHHDAASLQLFEALGGLVWPGKYFLFLPVPTGGRRTWHD